MEIVPPARKIDIDETKSFPAPKLIKISRSIYPGLSEDFDRIVFPLMLNFTKLFSQDIDFDKIREEKIETVYNGYYLTGKNAYKPVAITVPLANTASGHNFIEEI